MRKYIHKKSGKELILGGNLNLSLQTLIGNSNLTVGDILNKKDWEEIIEKEYKILSFICVVNKKIANIQENGNFLYLSINSSDYKGTPLKWMLDDSTHKIYSIQRLSDGEIFTVGDIIENNIIINEFVITPCNNINIWCNYVNTKEKRECLDDFLILLKHCKHFKKPLFTTEDGVDIFKGDIYWWLNKESFQYGFDDNIETSFFNNVFEYLYFSTKKATEEYILINKVCLSYKDVIILFEDKQSRRIKSFTEDLIKTVKSKL